MSLMQPEVRAGLHGVPQLAWQLQGLHMHRLATWSCLQARP